MRFDTPPTDEEMKVRLEALSRRLENTNNTDEPKFDFGPNAWSLLKFRVRHGTYGLRQGLKSGRWFRFGRVALRTTARACIFLGAGVLLYYELREWHDDRVVRNWQLLATNTPGNGGKTTALDFLNDQYGCLPFGISLPLMGNCWKNKADLSGINLSADTNNGSVRLNKVKLADARLSGSNFSEAIIRKGTFDNTALSHSILTGTHIWDSSFKGAQLSFADLSDSSLLYNSFENAVFSGSNLSGVGVFANPDFDIEVFKGAWAWEHRLPKLVTNRRRSRSHGSPAPSITAAFKGDPIRVRTIPQEIIAIRLDGETRKNFVKRMKSERPNGPWRFIKPQNLPY